MCSMHVFELLASMQTPEHNNKNNSVTSSSSTAASTQLTKNNNTSQSINQKYINVNARETKKNKKKQQKQQPEQLTVSIKILLFIFPSQSLVVSCRVIHIAFTIEIRSKFKLVYFVVVVIVVNVAFFIIDQATAS